MEDATQSVLLEEDHTNTHSTGINLELEGAGVVWCPYHWQGSKEILEVFEGLVAGWGLVEGDGRAGEVHLGSSLSWWL